MTGYIVLGIIAITAGVLGGVALYQSHRDRHKRSH
jgi:hypothetical protein